MHREKSVTNREMSEIGERLIMSQIHMNDVSFCEFLKLLFVSVTYGKN